jgi:hypothetical protein
MWFENRITKEALEKEINEKREQVIRENPDLNNDEIEYLLSYDYPELYRTLNYKESGKPFSWYADAIELGLFDYLTKEQIINTLLCNDVNLFCRFSRHYNRKLDNDDWIILLEALIQHENFMKLYDMFVNKCAERDLMTVANHFKEHLKTLAVEKKLYSALVVYVARFGIDELTDDEIKNIIKTNLWFTIILFVYPEKADIRRVNRIYNSLSHAEFVSATKPYLHSWQYTEYFRYLTKEQLSVIRTLFKGVDFFAFRENKLTLFHFLAFLCDYYLFCLIPIHYKEITLHRGIRSVIEDITSSTENTKAVKT